MRTKLTNGRFGVVHGKSFSTTYKSWDSMIQRCTNPKNPAYHHYGGRGITVCDRWKEFENFFADMGERPKGLELEREDNNLGYAPGNCRWATRSEQLLNRSNTRLLTIGGVSRTHAAWAKIAGVNSGTFKGRIDRGWSPEEALSKPGGGRHACR